ncbi:MAG: flagellar biosynthetic protein FliR [Alphaproteobacteria bacterium]|nr:flagellar biosynthetic protein FliR [Alphaproteobacteria bacterium]
MNRSFLIQEFYQFFIVFIRVAGMVITMPAFGQAEIPPRFRAMMAIVIGFSMTPFLSQNLPSDFSNYMPVAFLMIRELAIGLFIGLVGRTLLGILDVAGSIISYQLNLSNATLFNPSMASQGVITAMMLSMAGTTLILVLDLHHLMIYAVIHSYALFPVQAASAFLADGHSMIGDMAHTLVHIMGRVFVIAVQFSSPFLLVGIILQLAFGLLNRLVPQMQIFFVAMPLQIGLGLFVLALVISGMLLSFGEQFANEFSLALKLM